MLQMSFAARPRVAVRPAGVRPAAGLPVCLTVGAAAAVVLAALGWSGPVDSEILGASALLLGGVALPRATGHAPTRGGSLAQGAAPSAACDAQVRRAALTEQWDRDAQRDWFGLPDLATTGAAPAREAAVALELDALLERFDRLPPFTGGAQAA